MMDPAHFEATAKGDLDEFPFCDIDQPGMSIIFNKASPLGNTMLHVAASYNHKDMFELMARQFPDLITKTNNRQDTGLHVAARAGNLETVATLVYCSKQIPTTTSAADSSLLKMKNDKGNTALHDAFSSLLATEYMGRKASDKTLDLAALALHLASQDPEVLYFKNKADKSPLCLAVESGKKDILEYLLAVLAEVHRSDDRRPEGKSPVHVAIMQKGFDLLKTFREKKPELLHLRDEKGNTPLHYAASISFEGVRYLIEVNRDSVLDRNVKGLYPLHVACKNGHVEITKELLRKWPDPTELLCNKGRNILHVATKSGKQEVVNCIMKEANVDKLINEVDKDGNTPLHLATLGSHYFVVGILLWDKRINSDLKNNQGLTAYDIAAKQSAILETNFAGNHIISENEKDQQVCENIADDESSKAVGYMEKQPTKADSKKSKISDGFEAMTTLSIFVCRSCRHFRNHLVSIENRHRKSKFGINEDVKNRINNLLVVATVIVGATFAASVQMTSSGGGPSGDDGANQDQNLKQKIKFFKSFLLFDTLAMNISIVAAFLLCWAQLVASNLASSIVQVVFGLLGFALYMTTGHSGLQQ